MRMSTFTSRIPYLLVMRSPRYFPLLLGQIVSNLGDTLNDSGLDGLLARVRALVTERRPGVLAIDSFKALSAYAATPKVFRGFLHELAGILTAVPTTTLWVGEYGPDEIATAPEFAVADGIISLATRREAERAIRHLEVLKLRGTGFSRREEIHRGSERTGHRM